MKVKTVTVSKARTINLGDYNSIKIQYGISVELDEGDKYGETFQFAETIVDEKLDEEHAKWK
jgi:hypothetical protein